MFGGLTQCRESNGFFGGGWGGVEFKANDFSFSPETKWIWGFEMDFRLAHQLKKFRFLESQIIPQVVKIEEKNNIL